MYQFFICDDDSSFTSGLESMLSEMLKEHGIAFHIRQFSDPAQVLDALKLGASCDLLFLDILFGREKGVSFAKLLRERNWDIELVFISSTSQYALDSYDVYPLHYLLKPVSPDQLCVVLERFLERHTPHLLSLTTPQGMIRIPVTDVLFFEIYRHIIEIHLCSGDSQSWRGTLQELESTLPEGRFVRIHRSFLVNLEHIARIGHNQLRLSSGDLIPMSKTDYSNVQVNLIAFDRRRHLSG